MQAEHEVRSSELGARLRERREELGLTPSDVASRSGLGQSTVEAYEKGTREPTYSNLLNIGRALLVVDLNFFKRRSYDEEVRMIQGLHEGLANLADHRSRRSKRPKVQAPGQAIAEGEINTSSSKGKVGKRKNSGRPKKLSSKLLRTNSRIAEAA